jgi:catechol 2,3-dioxygenase-like lactoylglutathione lyase family enzyme
MAGAPHHIDLTVTDLAASVDFYDKVLGRLGYRRTDAYAGAAPCWALDAAPGRPFSIALHAARQLGAHDRYRAGLHHLAFAADGRDEVDAFHAFLREAGIRVLDPPADYDYSPGYYAVFFADPDGLKLEVVHEPKN